RAAPAPRVRETAKGQVHTIPCATAFAQKAGVAALRGPTTPLQAMVKEFRARRDLVLKELATIEALSTHRPTGALYVFPRYDAEIDSATLSERILKEASVAVTPGSAFGEAGEGHLRISYAASRETIAEGLHRIREVFAR